MYNTSHHYLTRSIEQFMYKVYGWMFAGLTLTACAAYSVYSQPNLMRALLSNTISFYGILLAQLGLVIYLSARITRMSYATAAMSFIAYSLLTGVTFSSLFVVYQLSSLTECAIITAGMFGIMAIYGYFTKTDLSSFGNIFLMALIGIILATVVNMFFGNTLLDTIISYLGVAIFSGLTAYDVQKIKRIGLSIQGLSPIEGNIAIMGALTLYLDFVNLFLYLLRLMGKRRK